MPTKIKAASSLNGLNKAKIKQNNKVVATSIRHMPSDADSVNYFV